MHNDTTIQQLRKSTGLGTRKTYSPTIYHWYDGTNFRTGKRTFRERISYGSESI